MNENNLNDEMPKFLYKINFLLAVVSFIIYHKNPIRNSLVITMIIGSTLKKESNKLMIKDQRMNGL
ncbi:hypothetical protein [Seonamhaeicola sp. ML3]|uniref:hypothetical protein n=1 Tax=Seonamhaeicola sp. ML3 TaxID=2937786 RepID=UPI00200FB5DF|nr:hypothetical protein [Seonamhaeicola sp. ML3]